MWIPIEDVNPNYSGYAWVQFWRKYDNPAAPEYVHLCRIWNTSKSTSWWEGWDLDFDDAMTSVYNKKVILIAKPDSAK